MELYTDMQTTWIPSPFSHHLFKDTMTDTYTYAVKDRQTHTCAQTSQFIDIGYPHTHSTTDPHQFINKHSEIPTSHHIIHGHNDLTDTRSQVHTSGSTDTLSHVHIGDHTLK